jgi:hypothetical protein
MMLTRSLPAFGRYTEMSSILIGVSSVSFLLYWATHFRRELTVVRNLLDCAGSQILS